MKWLYKLFNNDKIDELNRTIDIYKERTEQLEKELREYKGYKLKYRVAKMLAEDDDGILELIDLAKKADEYNANVQRDALSNNQFGRGQQGIGAILGNLGIASANRQMLAGQPAAQAQFGYSSPDYLNARTYELDRLVRGGGY